MEKMDLLDKKLNHIRYNTDRLSDLSEEEIIDFIASKKLDNGEITQQMIACIMLDIFVEGNPSIRDRVIQLFRMRKASITSVSKLCQEYANNLGDKEDIAGTEKLNEYQRVRTLLQKFEELV
ncbi:hypothetical protein Ciccas_002828 [Cichlidogyrus casuarinus]|uniref:Uncharacterized protein n=1 Tax=Cichlidogyrus casuarinus TaxID=1844966 RepID=A0ABD2QGR0_9PLAT